MLAVSNLLVVLVSGQTTQPAWQSALAWQVATGADLHVFVPVRPDKPAGLELAEGLQQMAADAAESDGERWLADWLQDAPAAATTRTVSSVSRSCEAVLHEARRQDADLLVMAADALTPRELQQLMRQLPCPLYLVRRTVAPARLAAALGVVADDPPHKLLNTVVLEHLAALADLFGASRLVLSALPSPADIVPLMGDAYAVSYASQEFEQTYREALIRQISPFGLSDADLFTQPGRPDLALPQMVAANQVDCLLLGTVGRQALAAFWLGNTAEDVLPRVDCDVLVLRPQDYYDPR
jgi:universal stress protein E